MSHEKKSTKEVEEVKQVEEVKEVITEIEMELLILERLKDFVVLDFITIAKMTKEERTNYIELLTLYNNAQKKVNSNKTAYLNRFDFCIGLIYNAGFDGITVEGIFNKVQTYTNSVGKIDGYSLGQVVTQFNTKDECYQRAHHVLNKTLPKGNSKRRVAVECELFSQNGEVSPSSHLGKAGKRNNNRLAFISGMDNVKDYLILHGAKQKLDDKGQIFEGQLVLPIHTIKA